MARGEVLLRLRHRLMCRAARSKPIAVFGEGTVPAPLQNLHHRLLDQSIHHRQDGRFIMHLPQ
jgi:hypothetical protein